MRRPAWPHISGSSCQLEVFLEDADTGRGPAVGNAMHAINIHDVASDTVRVAMLMCLTLHYPATANAIPAMRSVTPLSDLQCLFCELVAEL